MSFLKINRMGSLKSRWNVEKNNECEETYFMILKRGKTMKEVYEFLKKAGTYYLATVEGDQPRVRPFGTVDLFEDRL